MFDKDRVGPAIEQIIKEVEAGDQFPLSNSVRHVSTDVSGTGKTRSADGTFYLPETIKRSFTFSYHWNEIRSINLLTWIDETIHDLMNSKEDELMDIDGEQIWVQNWPIRFEWGQGDNRCLCRLSMRGAAVAAIEQATVIQ